MGIFRKMVVVESPFKGNELHIQEENERLAKQCCRFVMKQGHNPFASHLLYPRFMDDTIAKERGLGIAFGLAWGMLADEVWFFKREGEAPSGGMIAALAHWRQIGKLLRFFDVTLDGKFLAIAVDGEKVPVIEEV